METQQNLQANNKKLSASFFFLSLGLLITLITSVVSFLNLTFSTLENKFPDVLNSSYQYGYSDYTYEGIRTALAVLVIFFPVFLIVSYFWDKHIKGILGSVDEIIKKWLLYVVLFLSSIVIMVDLVALIRYFISGEITTRFILKVLVTLTTALVVGLYYILVLKNKKYNSRIGLIFSAVCILFVFLAIFYSFLIMGSPMKQRTFRLDNRRVSDLQSIQYQVINYWQQKEKLPENLSEFKDPISSFSLPIDPEFDKGKIYEYYKKTDLTFELCAEFSAEMPKGWIEYGGGVMPMFKKDIAVSSYPYPGGINDSWDHGVGKTCFERTIDKDLYPPFEKQVR